MTGEKILVAGGLGFTGSNLVCELERRGREVWVCGKGCGVIVVAAFSRCLSLRVVC